MNRVKVQNPLTIIAIFAGIAEVAGTTVLLGLPLDVQKVFVWFVMIFPVALVCLFFIVLIFKHKVLYAPSDFSNEELFIQLIQKQQVISKANELVAEQALQVIKKPQVENSEKVNDFLGKLNVVLKDDDIKKINYNHEIKKHIRAGYNYQSVLNLIKRSDNPILITDLHAKLGLSINTLRIILKSMEDKDIIEFDGTNVNYLGDEHLN